MFYAFLLASSELSFVDLGIAGLLCGLIYKLVDVIKEKTGNGETQKELVLIKEELIKMKFSINGLTTAVNELTRKITSLELQTRDIHLTVESNKEVFRTLRELINNIRAISSIKLGDTQKLTTAQKESLQRLGRLMSAIEG